MKIFPIATALGVVGIFVFVHHYKHITIPKFQGSSEVRSRGSFHVHSSISHDSRLSLEDIAHAAQKVGQDFVVLTEHNKVLEKSVLIDGVLLLAATELTTKVGHLISIGASEVLSKDKRQSQNVVQNLYSIGGFGVIAHPADTKLPWKGSVINADGIEIVSASSAGRRLAGPAWLGALPLAAVYAVNAPFALAQLYDRDDEALRLWDSTEKAVGFCGADAHGWFDLSRNLQTWTLVLEEKLQGDAEAQNNQLKYLLSSGRFFCAAGVLGGNPKFTWEIAKPPSFTITGPGLPNQEIVLYKDGKILQHSTSNVLQTSGMAAGLYRVEVHTQIPDLLGDVKNKVVLYSQRLRVAP
jgi:hypothetical protein